MIEHGVCYLTLCEAVYPKKMAFGFLEDLHTEFYDNYGRKVPTVTRPYSFIEFGNLKKLFTLLRRKHPSR